eukprot:4316561-Pyramimonas_sp.AAC.1
MKRYYESLDRHLFRVCTACHAALPRQKNEDMGWEGGGSVARSALRRAQRKALSARARWQCK